MNRSQQGFTIIELVIVIAILGILGAVALPKFADLSTDAKRASYQGMRDGFKSSVMIAHSKWLASGADSSAVTSVTIEGGQVLWLNTSG